MFGLMKAASAIIHSINLQNLIGSLLQRAFWSRILINYAQNPITDTL
jgi:hypothetical protein